MENHQYPDQQCEKDVGPLPEGTYKIYHHNLGTALDDGTSSCTLKSAWGVQAIPCGSAAGQCEPYWTSWGRNRARIEPANEKAKKACGSKRSGFYIHDSTKGYSHGCIEVQTSFFTELATAVGRGEDKFYIKVAYIAGRKINGGTKLP